MSKRPNVPDDQRAAYEATDDALNDLSGLLVALDLMIDSWVPDSADRHRNALNVMIEQSQKKLADITALRDAEWRSIGGNVPK